MNGEQSIKKLHDTAIFEDHGEFLSKAIATIFVELNDKKAVRNVSIHLREDDQSKVLCVEFVMMA